MASSRGQQHCADEREAVSEQQGRRRDGDPVEDRDEQARRAGEQPPAIVGSDIERAVAQDPVDAGERYGDESDEDRRSDDPAVREERPETESDQRGGDHPGHDAGARADLESPKTAR